MASEPISGLDTGGTEDLTATAARGTLGRSTWLLIHEPDQTRRVQLVQDVPLVIGRDPTVEIPIAHRSLSRRHARVTLTDGEVWVEDLESRNGTRVNGEPADRRRLEQGDLLTLGAISASLHFPAEIREALVGHDRFSLLLAHEIERAQSFRRTLALLTLEVDPARLDDDAGWPIRVARALRTSDRISVYAPGRVEAFAAEVDETQLERLARSTQLALGEGARCGAALFPRHASSREALIAAAHEALLRADDSHPCVLAPSLAQPSWVKGSSPPPRSEVGGTTMRRLEQTIARIAASDSPVLVYGETGVGKEVAARAIHHASGRGEQPMCCVNCAALPLSLLESLLFGHEQGAFTGAASRKLGIFESASGGTVFLDEIGELPAAAQAALLRVIDQRRLRRVGGNEEIAVDVRVLVATHRDLAAMCDAGTFRRDLYYRLNVFTLEVPALRRRKSEIPELVEAFLATANRDNRRTIEGIDEPAMRQLLSYDWPGNIRELRNVIERAVVVAEGLTITVEDLPDVVQEAGPCEGDLPSGGSDAGGAVTTDLRRRLERYEARMIEEMLDETDGNKTEAARRLRLPIRTLSRKIRRYGIGRASDDGR